MEPAVLVERAYALAAVVIFAAGLGAALAAQLLLKRVIGLILAIAASALLLGASSSAPSALGLAVTVLAMAAAFGLLGVALAVRLRESYDAADAAALDAADAATERTGQGP